MVDIIETGLHNLMKCCSSEKLECSLYGMPEKKSIDKKNLTY